MPEEAGPEKDMSKELGIPDIELKQVQKAADSAREAMRTRPEMAGGAPWLYQNEGELDILKSADLKRAVRHLEGTFAGKSGPRVADELARAYGKINDWVLDGRVDPAEAQDFLVKINARIEELDTERVRNSGTKKESPFTPELPKTQEEWLKLVRSQLLDLMFGKARTAGSWLEKTTVSQPGWLPLGDALRHMLPEIAAIPVTYEYAGKRKTKSFREALENETMAIEALSKAFEAWGANAITADKTENILSETVKAGAIINPDYFEAIATLMPDIKSGNQRSGILTGDIVSTLFLNYRKLANGGRPEGVDFKKCHNFFANRAHAEEIEQTREVIRESVGGKNKDDLVFRYADEIALRLIKVFGEAAWADKKAEGQTVPGSDGSAQLMYFEQFRKDQKRKQRTSGPHNTIEGAYPKHVFLPFMRMFQGQDSSGTPVYFSEMLDASRPLKEIDLRSVKDTPNPHESFLLKLLFAARLFKALMDEKGEAIDLTGFQELNATIDRGLFGELIQFENNPDDKVPPGYKTIAEYWEKNEDFLKEETKRWQRRVRYKYVEGLKWALTPPRGKLDSEKFLFGVALNAESAGTITWDDANEISGYAWIASGLARFKKLVGLRRD